MPAIWQQTDGATVLLEFDSVAETSLSAVAEGLQDSPGRWDSWAEVQGTHASRRGVPISYYGAPGACEHRAVGVAGREMQDPAVAEPTPPGEARPSVALRPGLVSIVPVGLAGRGVQGSGTDAGRRGAPSVAVRRGL